MALKESAEQRFFPRYLLVVPDFPGRLLGPGGHDLNAKVLDVSRDGLGAVLPVFL